MRPLVITALLFCALLRTLFVACPEQVLEDAAASLSTDFDAPPVASKSTMSSQHQDVDDDGFAEPDTDAPDDVLVEAYAAADLVAPARAPWALRAGQRPPPRAAARLDRPPRA